MESDELLASVKEQLRASVQRKMEQPSTKALRDFLGVVERPEPQYRQALIDGTACLLPNAVDRCITDIMHLGYNATFDAAVTELFEIASALGGSRQPRKAAIKSIEHELKLCGDAFRSEIALFKRMHELTKSSLSNQEVWSQISEVR